MGHPPFTIEKQEELRKLYNQGIKVTAIATRLGVSRSCVSHWCRELGLRKAPKGYCPCGVELPGKTRQKCDKCRDEGKKRRTRGDERCSTDTGNYVISSANTPGHEDRLLAYQEKASLGLPLFDCRVKHEETDT